MKKFLKDLLNVPNSMSLLRLIATPTLVILWFYAEMPEATLIVGTAAGLTDLFDGLAARKLNQVTELGALIDQLGDLVFESTCLLLGLMIGEIWMGLLIIYLFREFTVTVIRTYVLSNGGVLPSSTLGKAKSSLIQYAFFLLFLGAILNQPGTLPADWAMCGIPPGRVLIWVGLASIHVGIICGLMAGWKYLKAFALFYAERVQSRSAN